MKPNIAKSALNTSRLWEIKKAQKKQSKDISREHGALIAVESLLTLETRNLCVTSAIKDT